jgi:hypothetical protein
MAETRIGKSFKSRSKPSYELGSKRSSTTANASLGYFTGDPFRTRASGMRGRDYWLASCARFLPRFQDLHRRCRLWPARFPSRASREARRGIAHIRSGSRVNAVRDPKQSKQSHDVIDAQTTRVTQGSPNGLDEWLVSGGAKLPRHERRQAPLHATFPDHLRTV